MNWLHCARVKPAASAPGRDRTAHTETRRRYKELKLVGNVLQVPFELMSATTIGAPGGGKCLWTTLVVDIVALLRNVSATSFKFIRSVQVGEHKNKHAGRQANKPTPLSWACARPCESPRFDSNPPALITHASHGTAGFPLRARCYRIACTDLFERLRQDHRHVGPSLLARGDVTISHTASYPIRHGIPCGTIRRAPWCASA